MREILFRGKSNWAYGNVKVGDWLYGMTISRHCYNDEEITSYYIGGGNKTIYGKTLGQFVGIIDKNGNKIFEGDIVKATIRRCYGSNPQIREETRIIAYDSLGILGLKDSEDVWSDFMNELSLSGCIEDYYFEVIGNIYDNPELLCTPQNDEVRE